MSPAGASRPHTRRIPKHRRFKPKDLGLVVIDGVQHPLGKYGPPESVENYGRLGREWLARGSAGQRAHARVQAPKR